MVGASTAAEPAAALPHLSNRGGRGQLGMLCCRLFDVVGGLFAGCSLARCQNRNLMWRGRHSSHRKCSRGRLLFGVGRSQHRKLVGSSAAAAATPPAIRAATTAIDDRYHIVISIH